MVVWALGWVGVEEGDWGGCFVGGCGWEGQDGVCVWERGWRWEDEVIEGLGVRKWVDIEEMRAVDGYIEYMEGDEFGVASCVDDFESLPDQ